jgi:hypothetical protein
MIFSPKHLTGIVLMTLACSFSSVTFANHSVLVEGESDFDGDGMMGMAEDEDGDQVFGTITRALGGAPGISQNGRITVVTSGRFLEQIVNTAAGVVVLEAAPGVNAVIEAFGAGAAGNEDRQQAPGITVDSNGDFPVIIRNIVSRNWTTGFLIMQRSHVQLDSVRADSNVNYGINVIGEADVVIRNAEVIGTGFRNSGTAGLDVPAEMQPMPGIGIAFEESSEGKVTDTTVAHSYAAGIANRTGNRKRVDTARNTVFNNKVKASGGGNGNHDRDDD